MLVLSRKENESIIINGDIKIIISSISKNGVKLGIEAPKNMTILRSELVDEIKSKNALANHEISAEELAKLSDKFKK
ncbi:carbon storage regulator CsrA [Campylobacter sp. 19-13652]|uniref:carbon storage regulator CsrA n=1 Tax=Campylobacter sp. 19-13652 TaxID=2840180 RepID=UPI001C7925DE|nr:carbon storage regulator CsrA [Campylobacter sp. 19-13652]BCX79335.1 carbon storage regulator [Campylobacter sp. 19-13652]